MGDGRGQQNAVVSSGPQQQLMEPAAHLACPVCYREIPVSVALWRESSDYAAYFCGFECYDRWRNQRGDIRGHADLV